MRSARNADCGSAQCSGAQNAASSVDALDLRRAGGSRRRCAPWWRAAHVQGGWYLSLSRWIDIWAPSFVCNFRFLEASCRLLSLFPVCSGRLLDVCGRAAEVEPKLFAAGGEVRAHDLSSRQGSTLALWLVPSCWPGFTAIGDDGRAARLPILLHTQVEGCLPRLGCWHKVYQSHEMIGPVACQVEALHTDVSSRND